MDKDHYAWDHFKFNAEQRLKGFNFFILLSIFADGGVFTAIEKGLSPFLLLLLGLFIVLLAGAFWVVDTRSRRLLHLAIPALKTMEQQLQQEYRFFNKDEANNNNWLRFTTAIRALFASQCLFGLGVAVYGASLLVTK